MKRCELCSHLARMYCQSDNASLCYDCDQNVHSANFLVAKHSRTLLCHKCQSPTPWNASGLNLGRTASVCVNCLHENPSQSPEGETSLPGNDVVVENCVVHDDEEDGDTEDDDTESSDESEDEDEDSDSDEDAENQVVPLSSAASPPATGCSSSEEFSSSSEEFSSDGFRSASKRERLDYSIDSEKSNMMQDDSPCSSERSNCKRRTEIDDAISLGSYRPY